VQQRCLRADRDEVADVGKLLLYQQIDAGDAAEASAVCAASVNVAATLYRVWWSIFGLLISFTRTRQLR